MPKDTKTMQSVPDLLRQALEQYTHQKFEDLPGSEPFDIHKQMAREARQAREEVSKSMQEERAEQNRSLRRLHHIRQTWQFGSAEVTVDDNNRDGFTRAQVFCQNAEANFARNNPVPMLFIITGLKGSGKTVLANCMANYFLDRTDMSLEYVNFREFMAPRLFADRETVADKRAREQVWERYLDSDVLILDGLCNDLNVLTDFEQNSLAEMFEGRVERSKPLVITAPVPMNELQRAIAKAFESLKAFGPSAVVLLYGPSRRPGITLKGVVYK